MKLSGMIYARFEVPDLARTEAFARDFGLISVERTDRRLVMRTSGNDLFSYVAHLADAPRFHGFGIRVESTADLDDAVASFGATDRRTLGTPGGGDAVTLTDPDGNRIDLVYGMAGGEADPVPTPDLAANSPGGRIRHGDSQHRRAFGPAQLFRLGHIGLFVRDFARSAEWYGRVLGMIGSDVYHVPHNPEHNIVGFMRLNRGDEWVDHHMIALMQRETPDCHHISFEAQDFEAQFVAHRFLKGKGYESIWGVGRHPHGSHVFDVWRDPHGWRFETFSDTDLLNADRPTRYHNVKDVEMDIWSSDPPDRYLPERIPMTDFAPETGLASGSFGIGTFRSHTGEPFPAIVRPDGSVQDVSDLYTDTHAIFDDWDRALDTFVDLAARGGDTRHQFSALQALPPLAHPNLLGAGANYRQHVAEMMTHNRFNQHSRLEGEADDAFFQRNLAAIDKRAREGMPFFWTGLHSSLTGANSDLSAPLIGDQLDWELEFAAVVARGKRYVAPADANDLVAGYMMVNDVGTVDEFRRVDVNWGFDWVSKHQPGFKIAGPFIVPKQFVKLDEVCIHLSVNGVTKQDWPISDMIFNVEQILSYASERVKLLPGDMLLTGSPPGNGAMHGHFLEPGDVMDGEITFLGQQHNKIVAEDTQGRTFTYGKFQRA